MNSKWPVSPSVWVRSPSPFSVFQWRCYGYFRWDNSWGDCPENYRHWVSQTPGYQMLVIPYPSTFPTTPPHFPSSRPCSCGNQKHPHTFLSSFPSSGTSVASRRAVSSGWNVLSPNQALTMFTELGYSSSDPFACGYLLPAWHCVLPAL